MRIVLGCITCAKNQLLNSYGRHFSRSAKLLKPDDILRRPRIKQVPNIQSDQLDYKICNAYCTGESYNLEEVRKYFIKDASRYTLGLLPKDAVDVLHVLKTNSNEEKGDIFLFRRLGAFVCWNIPDEEMSMLNQVLREFVINAYSTDTTEKENEQMSYFTIEGNTALLDGDIYLNTTSSDQRQVLERLAFSNAMALSVKLDMWELSLETFSGSLRYVPELLKNGTSRIMSRKEVLQKIGELLTIRHEINLYSDLLTTPDFYWDREDLENLYSRTCAYLEISKRTKVMNEKLNLCSELVEMLRSHLSDQHSHRLEWMIILLITIEVLFEVIRLAERFC